MPKLRRLKLSLKRDHALEATRVSIGNLKLVYVLIADKRVRYRDGRSRIVYIGTTKHGARRVAQSIAFRAESIFAMRGVRSFHARVVTCKPRRNVTTWRLLERAFLVSFREKYGEVPKCNKHGKRMTARTVFNYFRKRGVQRVLEDLT